MNILPKIFGTSNDQRQAELERSLIRVEAKMGGELFGPVPASHRREFFCLDRHTWIWHEEWVDGNGKRNVVTTRYTVRPNGILKSQGNQTYQRLTKEEAQNLYTAFGLYRQRIGQHYQQMLQTA